MVLATHNCHGDIHTIVMGVFTQLSHTGGIHTTGTHRDNHTTVLEVFTQLPLNIIMETCKAKIQSKTAERCAVIHYIQIETEQEKILTQSININIQLYQSIHLTHVQAISSTVKSHNYLTLKKRSSDE